LPKNKEEERIPCESWSDSAEDFKPFIEDEGFVLSVFSREWLIDLTRWEGEKLFSFV
jgi:hypothetical protein